MLKTTEIECHSCGSIWVGDDAPYDFLRRVCPKRGGCTASIVSRYVETEEEPCSAMTALSSSCRPSGEKAFS